MKYDFLKFKRTVIDHFSKHGRKELPWRKTTDPYAILVSEIMLQQTQVDRVIPYFEAFLQKFPTIGRLARARTGTVLKSWQGLGYNRRALMLQRCARALESDYGGVVPADFEKLKALPGLGPYTAGAVLVFAFNKPYPLIETNIRRIYIHHFFPRAKSVSDEPILRLVEKTMNRRNPRKWFGALMDYGSWLASQVPNPNRKSNIYSKQSRFEGSERQLRGRVLRELLKRKIMAVSMLKKRISDARLESILAAMEREGFVVISRGRVRCA